MSFCSLLQCLQVQTKELEGGHKLTFMKFTFQSPALEIKAPVLNDKTVGYQVIYRIQQVEPSYHSFPSFRCSNRTVPVCSSVESSIFPPVDLEGQGCLR